MHLVDTSIDIDAPPELVFELFSTADGLCQWMAADASVDLLPDGAWQWTHDDGNVCSGRYLAIDPPRRLSFTYGWESGGFADVVPGSTQVDVEFVAIDRGTTVRLTHSGLSAERAADHTIGWNHFLGVLQQRVGQLKEHD